MAFTALSEPVIIATKGLPFTDRESFSHRIARWARSPIFSLYNVLKMLFKEAGYTNADSVPSKAEDERLQQHAFAILCDMAKIVPRLGSFWDVKYTFVVIESPLSHTYQLDQLIELSYASGIINIKPTTLIIIECQVRKKRQWQMRASRYTDIFWEDIAYKLCWGDSDASSGMWFVPKNWRDAEMEIYDYDTKAWDDHFHLQSSKHRHVKRLVLDPLRDLVPGELEEELRTSPFVEAIRYILNHLGEAPPVIELDQWRRKQLEVSLLHPSREKISTVDLCSNGDCLFTYREDLGEEAGACRVCEEPLTQQAYTCRFCSLTLHKSCAEIVESKVPYKDEQGSSFDTSSSSYGFPQLHACTSCIEKGKDFSYSCGSCIFQTHLKCRLMPTIINDGCHQDILSVRLAPNQLSEHGSYECQACGERGVLCSYFCMFCRFYYHIRCANLPREVNHEHGGYEHLVKLMFSQEEEQEDYWCDVCYKDMDPEHWFYSCQLCPYYVAHINCIVVKPKYEEYKLYFG